VADEYTPSEAEVTILTERRVVDVTPGLFVGSNDRVEFDVCVTCGSVVFDVVLHDAWHRTQFTPSPEKPQ